MSNAVVLVLSWNGEAFLRPCLSALLAQQFSGNNAILVVDNASSDASVDLIKDFGPQVALIQNTSNLGFAAGNNVGLRALLAGTAPLIDFRPDTIVLLNQDTEVAPDWLQQLIQAFERAPNAGIVGCKIFFPDGKTLQHAGGRVSWPLATGIHRGEGEVDTGQYDAEEPVEFVTGAAMAVRAEVFGSIGLFDEGFTPAYYEDTDLCYRARAAGFGVVYTPHAHLIHHEGSSLGLRSPAHQRAYHRNRIRFLLKHSPLDKLEEEFVPQECEEIGRWSVADSLARKHAYFEALLALPDYIMPRYDDEDRAAAHARLKRVFRLLHHTVVEEERARRTENLTPQRPEGTPGTRPSLRGKGVHGSPPLIGEGSGERLGGVGRG